MRCTCRSTGAAPPTAVLPAMVLLGVCLVAIGCAEAPSPHDRDKHIILDAPSVTLTYGLGGFDALVVASELFDSADRLWIAGTLSDGTRINASFEMALGKWVEESFVVVGAADEDPTAVGIYFYPEGPVELSLHMIPSAPLAESAAKGDELTAWFLEGDEEPVPSPVLMALEVCEGEPSVEMQSRCMVHAMNESIIEAGLDPWVATTLIVGTHRLCITVAEDSGRSCLLDAERMLARLLDGHIEYHVPPATLEPRQAEDVRVCYDCFRSRHSAGDALGARETLGQCLVERLSGTGIPELTDPIEGLRSFCAGVHGSREEDVHFCEADGLVLLTELLRARLPELDLAAPSCAE